MKPDPCTVLRKERGREKKGRSSRRPSPDAYFKCATHPASAVRTFVLAFPPLEEKRRRKKGREMGIL